MDVRTEFARLWRSPIPGIELFEAHLVDHQFGKHFHDAYTIGLNQSGRGQCLYQKKSHYHHPGSFNFINPGEVHTGAAASANGWAFRNIYITGAAVQQILTQLGWKEQNHLPVFSSIVVEDPTLHIPFYQLFHALFYTPTDPLAQQSYLLHFFAQLFSRHIQSPNQLNAPKAESTAVSQTRTYLEARCTEPVSINELAKLVNLNPYYLIRCFSREMGLPPHSYKKHWQLLQAKQALHQGESLAAIALQHGFYDQSHFTHTFKRAFGLTPGRYRKVNFIQ